MAPVMHLPTPHVYSDDHFAEYNTGILIACMPRSRKSTFLFEDSILLMS
jgi:hypothetical protein